MSLTLRPALSRPDLLAKPVAAALGRWPAEIADQVEVAGAEPVGFINIPGHCGRAEDEHRQHFEGGLAADLPQHVQTRHQRHLQIEQHEAGEGV